MQAADELAERLDGLSVGGLPPADDAIAPRDDAQAALSPVPGVAGQSAYEGTLGTHADADARALAPGTSDQRKLFVGGLPQGATEELIDAVFAPHGSVEEVHLIKPNPSSESKRGCCFVTFTNPADADDAITALNGQVSEALGSTMPLLVRVADPPRSREEQRTRAAAHHLQRSHPSAALGVVPGYGMGYGWPPQQGAFGGGQSGQPFYLQQGPGAGQSAGPGAQYMGVFPGGYQFGMPQFAAQHGEWSEHADGDGNKYYYNTTSGVSQWEAPAHWPTQQTQQLPMIYPYAHPIPAGYFAQASGNGAAALAGLTGSPGSSSGKRGPKGANLAIFCIPNSYTDNELHEIARPYGDVVYAQVSRHRDSGLSRGYGFVSYDSVGEALAAIEGIHGMVVQVISPPHLPIPHFFI